MKNPILPCTAALLFGLGANLAAAQPQTSPAPAQPSSEAVAGNGGAKLPEAKELPAAEARRLKEVGAKVFGIDWRGKVIAVSDRGFEVLTDGAVTLSYRPSGNAYFVQNKRVTLGDGGIQGPDERLTSRGKTILSRLGTDTGEIAEAKVLQQYVATGFADPATGEMKAGNPQKDRRTLLLTRQIRNLPVWSSSVTLDLDRNGNVASLEISWPKINPSVMEAAVKLQRMVAAGYKAPDLPYAKVEAVEAGILHSPAASFVDDQVAAIRVIYTPTDRTLGMKPVLYLGADGKPVTMPRVMEARKETPLPVRNREGSGSLH